MPIDFHFSVKDKLLLVKASGKDDSLEDVMNYSKAVLSEAVESQCTRILCDERDLEYALSVADTYSLANTASELVPRVIKIAIVCNSKSLPDGKFYETVGVNRGLVVRVMGDLNEAWEWLDH
jgi:hypothetical protein